MSDAVMLWQILPSILHTGFKTVSAVSAVSLQVLRYSMTQHLKLCYQERGWRKERAVMMSLIEMWG